MGLRTALVAPRYFGALERGKEQALATSLGVMREAIDRYVADRGRFPDSLDELARSRYIRAVPEDPVTGNRDSWQVQAPHAAGRYQSPRRVPSRAKPSAPLRTSAIPPAKCPSAGGACTCQESRLPVTGSSGTALM